MKNYKSAFTYAFQGFRYFLRSEKNAPLLLIASFLAIVFSINFSIDTTEWLFICLSICMVFAAEIFNTAIENMADRISLDKEEAIKQIKDLSAAACLFAVLFAALCALFIFIPKLA